jgi:hypothetical protein
MKYFSIPEPCSENWNEMTSTQKGAFCQKCSNEVHDVSQLSNDQIIGLIASESKTPCMRMTPQQETTLNIDLGQMFQSKKRNIQRAMLLSLLVVFGFSLFSCNDSQQIHERNQLQSAAENIIEIVEATSIMPIETKDISQVQAIKQSALPEIIRAPDPEILVEQEYLLGEPAMYQEVIFEEHYNDVIDVQRADLIDVQRIEVMHTMGVPAIRWDNDPSVNLVPIEVSTDLTKDQNSNLSESFSALTFPNPATTFTRLEVKIPNKTESLGIRLLSMNGEVLQEINDLGAEAGTHEFRIELIDLKPAFYLIDVRYNDQHEAVRLSKVQ